MINFLYYGIGGVVASVILTFGYSNTQDKPEIFFVMLAIAFIIFAIWTGVLLNSISEIIKAQLEDFYSIDTLKKEKASYTSQLLEYKTEMKNELLENYKKFEETIMSHIKDSKLIATILEKNGYSEVLKRYDSSISDFLTKIHNCDRKTDKAIANMQVRQNDPIYNYSNFIPKSIRYTESEK